MLSAETIAIVKSTAPALVTHGETLTRHFYRRMFEGDPQVRPLFNPANQHSGSQQRALAGAICAYAQNIDNLDALGAEVELIAQKHASLRVRPEHYPIVGKHLLAAIEDVLGDAATEEVVAAWRAAYGFLADQLTDRESAIYADHRREHGWHGFRPFVVARIVPESDRITSFHLEPREGGALAGWKPGQYVTIRVPSAETGTTMRNYSLSNVPGQGYYRISVKREPAREQGASPGLVSNLLHEQRKVGQTLEVGPPCGEFFLDLERARRERRPLVLLSGGVGITPLLSMFAAAAKAQLERPILFVHGAIHRAAHAFADEVRRIARTHGRSTVHFRYDSATPEDRRAGHCDSEGRIDVPFLRSLLPDLDADYYVCGPTPFMTGLSDGLREAGIPEQRIHVEFFGPKQSAAEPEGART